MKIRAFWDEAPCSLVEIERRFRGAYCLHLQDDECLTMVAIRTTETSVYSNETTRRYIPEGSNLHTPRRCENLKSHNEKYNLQETKEKKLNLSHYTP
jgi:hypothetical protein